MNFKNWLDENVLINEMPITGFTKIGDWNPDAKRKYGFNRQDAGIINNQRAVDKIHRKWSNSKQNFDLIFMRDKNAYKFREIGEVSSEWVKENLKIDVQPKDETITCIFTTNTGDEKVPMTAFVIAHRLGHAIRRDDNFTHYIANEIEKDFNDLLQNIYGISRAPRWDTSAYGNTQNNLKALALALGTMKSARDNNLRNFAEFSYELMAQYITTGHIKFNPLPKYLITKYQFVWGRPNHQGVTHHLTETDIDEWNEVVEGYAGKYEYYFDSVFSGLDGKIFVM